MKQGIVVLVALCAQILCSDGFSTPVTMPSKLIIPTATRSAGSKQARSPTALHVWWFGGTESGETTLDGDSCELVAVRIDRTSSNSRKIAGSISIEAPLRDVWAVLSDYNRLATHVPNLVESRIVSTQSKGKAGDGSFRCKLYQKGAQKIVGFEFGASVTMAMTERIVASAETQEERVIGFECVDSFFFSEFDGEWRATEQIGENGELETSLSYTVDVRPKGPVPVAALEWRIREDVPTNLRAVKKASMGLGPLGVLDSFSKKSLAPASGSKAPEKAQSSRSVVTLKTKPPPPRTETNAIRRAAVRYQTTAPNRRGLKKQTGQATKKTPEPVPAMARAARTVDSMRKRSTFKVTWDADETMAAYLREKVRCFDRITPASEESRRHRGDGAPWMPLP
ncbi:Polyketide cyclase / dehydrase and lipid transport [Seminavis robusta]|uniref:Polyketide cyclase / dehydrase and lipid transport n=1 Tax=Seminavis robusta TaxID=568900 RepID=A0A9N8EKL3_9STRA|nr:Polyketide cyclase / dehydrase and lipid transport [Seminavis robusta]|eukprot:Sro1421_g271230.1 Polyketide cyclase / dehydrase and lipid transport (396) ;mRNA; r:19150-20633